MPALLISQNFQGNQLRETWKNFLGFPGGSDRKETACNVGDLSLVPGLGRNPGEGHGNPLQYSCLENLMNGGGWQATVHGVSKSWTQQSDFTFLFLKELSKVYCAVEMLVIHLSRKRNSGMESKVSSHEVLLIPLLWSPGKCFCLRAQVCVCFFMVGCVWVRKNISVPHPIPYWLAC